jgi:hypothetical protein
MKLVTFTQRGRTRIGILDEQAEEIIDLSIAASKLPTI